MRSKFVFTSAALVSLCISLPSAAKIMMATYTGTFASGFDYTGVFSPPGTDLTGYNYVATFKYDRLLGSLQFNSSTLDHSSGGRVDWNVRSPIILSTITINDITLIINGKDYGLVRVEKNNIAQHLSIDSTDEFYSNSTSLGCSAFPIGAPGSLDSSFGPSVQTGGGCSLHARTSYIDSGRYISASPDLSAESTYEVRSAVPEPASWTLMIAGFGVVGASLRRRMHSLPA